MSKGLPLSAIFIVETSYAGFTVGVEALTLD